MPESERGEGLIEVVVAAAILALVLGVAVSGALASAHRFGAAALDDALRNAAQREARVAADVLKYQGGSIAPAAVATTVPMPGGSPVPVHLTISAVALAAGGYSLAITASADQTSESLSITTTLPEPAPRPSSQISSPGGGQAPM